MRIEIEDGPDLQGRFHYFLYWDDPLPVCCPTCGACSSKNCACYGPCERGQYFFAPIPAWAVDDPSRVRRVSPKTDRKERIRYTSVRPERLHAIQRTLRDLLD